MAYLKPDKIVKEHGFIIKQKIIPWGAVWPRNVYGADGTLIFAKNGQYKADRKLSGGTGKVQYITIHNTGTISVPIDTTMAEQYARATWPNCNMNDSRVHYYVDGVDCWQLLRDDEVGWHASDGYGPGNETSIAIEIIMNRDHNEQNRKAFERGAMLAAILLNRHGLGIEKLTTHNHWYKSKYCPAHILPYWSDFVELVEENLIKIKAKKTKFTPYLVRVTSDTTIYRGPGTNYNKSNSICGKGVYTIVEESVGEGASTWGKLKSGLGWIILDDLTKIDI